MIDSIGGFLVGDPPTLAEIETAREDMRLRARGRHERAMKVMMYTPIPIVDIAAGLATAAIGEAMSNDDPRLLDWDPRATSQDWSETDTTAAYVAKVRASGRQLTRAETIALDSHLKSVRQAKVTGEAVLNAAADVFKAWLK